MSRPLPDRPDLNQLGRQAEDLLRAARTGSPDAIGRVHAHLALRPGAAITLATAQLVIAREHGFAGWPALVDGVQARTPDLVGQLTELVTASVQGHFDPRGWIERATGLLAEHPEVTGYDIRIAAVLGDAGQVRRMLTRDPGLAVRPDEVAGWPPLLFVCNSRWHQIDPARGAGLVEVARLLLEAGADPNTAVGTSPRRGHCSALYAAAGLANHPALVRLLLERGADPDTPSALYHAAFHPDHVCLRLLLDHGARAEGVQSLGAAISVADTEAVRLLLDAGIDPRQPIPAEALAEAGDGEPPIPPVRAALQWRCDAKMIDLLLAHGAAPYDGDHGAAPYDGDDSGPSTYRLAERRGDAAITEALRRHGADDDSNAVDRFLGACARADHTAVRAQLDGDPGLLARLSTQDHAVLVDAAEHLGPAPVALMLELGFPANARRDTDGATALHVAAYAGRVDVVGLLLNHGADISVRDTGYRATPLSWASVGSGHPPRHYPYGDQVATIATLLDAGATLDEGWSIAKPPSDEAAALLLSHGIGSHDDITTPRPSEKDAMLIDTEQPLAVAVVEAIRTGDVARLKRLLAENPDLATARLGSAGPNGMSRTLLHVATDSPGHYPNGAATVAVLVEAGADVNAQFVGPHTETPLHWAASNDDVEALDALLDAGADIDAPGAVIGGGTPLADARAFRQWQTAHRLVERGAHVTLQDAATLGLLDRVRDYCTDANPPGPDEINSALWGACHGGRQDCAAYLLDRGADPSWIPPWEHLTPLDAATRSGATALVGWLRARKARSVTELDRQDP